MILIKEMGVDKTKTYKTNCIKNWQLDERPREKLIQKGADSLSNAELIAILIRAGNKEKNALELARDILKLCDNSLSSLREITPEHIQTIKGIGESKAVSIIAALELGKRAISISLEKGIQITSSDIIYDILGANLKHLIHEEFWVIYLDRANKIIKKEKLSRGGSHSTVVDIKIVVKRSINMMANSLIVVHNHPSGSIEPGEHDKVITKRLKEGLELFDMSLLDHIIIGDEKYFSFADEGIL